MSGLSAKFVMLMLAAALSGCSSNVIVDYDKAVNFTAFKTYTLLPKAEKSTEDPRLNSPLVDKRIAQAIDFYMNRKGLKKQNANADLQVKYLTEVKQEISSNDSGVSMLFGAGSHGSGVGIAYSVPTSDVQSQDNGVLTIDLISAKSQQLVWRGTSRRKLYSSGTPETSEEMINSLVEEILETYPPE
jgi:Domain of unknown function (DUF4136)